MAVLRRAFSFLHQTGCRIKNGLYALGIKRAARAPLPVLSVGNLSFGGTGKTPLALEILAYLRALGLKPALISRGYRGRWERSGGIVPAGGGGPGAWRDAGDEPALAARKLPGIGVFVGKSRLASCRKARDMGFQVAVLDDGFQHRRLERDLDIVLFDPAESSFLREPLSSLKRTDLILVRDECPASRPLGRAARFIRRDKAYSYKTVPDGLVYPDGRAAFPQEHLKGKKVLAFCGIARPDRFFELLEASGARVVRRFSFPDHFSYPPEALMKIRGAFEESGADVAVTTEKDAVKLDPPDGFPDGVPLFVFRIKLELPGRFFERIRETLRKHGAGTEPWPLKEA